MTQEVKEKALKIIAFWGFCQYVLANIVYDYMDYLPTIYVHQALAFTCYSFVLAYYIGFIGRVISWACSSQLFDEFIGNPREPHIAEYLYFIGYVIFEILNLKYKWLKQY